MAITQTSLSTSISAGQAGHIAASNTVQAAVNDLTTVFNGWQTTDRGVKTGALVFNVKDYGAVGDGVTNDTTALQAAISACVAAGGGVVFLPVGTFITTGLILYSYVILRGATRDKTIIRLAAGANTAVVKTYNADALFGTNSTGGEQHYAIQNLTLDGNKANNPSGSNGLKAYGPMGVIRDLVIQNCLSHGLYTDWNNAAAAADGQSYDARLDAVAVHDCGNAGTGNGIDWNGPHDARWHGVYAYNNANIGIRVGQNAGALVAGKCHSWGYGQVTAWQVETLAFLENCQGEGSSAAQLSILANGVNVLGGQWFAGDGRVQATTKGIIIGDATHTSITGVRLETSVTNCEGGSYDFTYSGGSGYVASGAYQDGASPAIVGSVPNNQVTLIKVTGARSADTIMYLPTSGIQVRGAAANAILVNGSVQMFQVNASSKVVHLPNAAKLVGYSDNYTTTTFSLEGGTGHWLSGGTATPAVAANAAAGTGASATISGNDTAGTVTVTTGTGPTTGTQATITFANAFASAPRSVRFTPESGAAALLSPYCSSRTTTTCAIGFAATPAASTAYTFTYVVIG